MEISRFSWLMLTLFFFSCETKESYTFNLPRNAKKMLSSDSAKTWILARRYNNDTRMNMGDCFLQYSQTFRIDGSMNDNAGENMGCGETLEASWKFIKSQNQKFYLRLEGSEVGKRLQIEENFKHFKILNLTDSLMKLQFFHSQFSTKASQITDLWVPEGTKVHDRNFHW